VCKKKLHRIIRANMGGIASPQEMTYWECSIREWAIRCC
jgi:hypothetical protein